jgi:hypothetical protein
MLAIAASLAATLPHTHDVVRARMPVAHVSTELSGHTSA